MSIQPHFDNPRPDEGQQQKPSAATIAFHQAAPKPLGEQSAFLSFDAGGLTKREYFAATALGACVSNPLNRAKHDANDYAKAAVLLADALLAELERRKP